MTKLHVFSITGLLFSLSVTLPAQGQNLKKICTLNNGNIVTVFTNLPLPPGTKEVPCPPADINPSNYGGQTGVQRQIPGKGHSNSNNNSNSSDALKDDNWDKSSNNNQGQQNNNYQGNNYQYTPPPPRITKEEEEKCEAFYKGLNAHKNDIKRLCDDEKFVDPIMTEEFGKCLGQIASISKNPLSGMLCYPIVKETKQSLSQESLNCLAESLGSADPSFPYLEIVVSAFNNSWGKNKTDYMVSDCLKLNHKKAESGKASIQNQFHFHKNTLRPARVKANEKKDGERDQLLGGLSGVWYDARTQKYYTVSDDQFTPFMTSFTWNAADPQSIPQFGNAITIQKPSNGGKLAASYDYEDIVRLNNGNFLISSEVGGEEAAEKSSGIFDFFFGSDKDKNDKPKFFLLYEINAEGKIIRGVPVADAILPKQIKVKVSYDCTPYKYDNNRNNNYNGGWDNKKDGGFRLDNDDKNAATTTTTSSTTTTTQKKVYCEREEIRDSQGFTHNKGIEALSYLESTQEIFYGTEAPLLQDKNKEKKEFVRIYRQTMDNEASTQRYVKYPLTNEFDNGMPALLALNENETLVLERGFDDYKKETHIKIFKIDWRQKDSDGYVVKKLVVTMNDIRDQMPAGFRRIDNLEGMARGPETATHLTLILIADNNFRDSQVTQFIAVQIPKELLR